MTEIEYSNNLISKYYKLFSNSVSIITMDRSIRAAMIDVTNTIEAIDWHEFETPNKELAYYNEVLNILKLMIFKCSNI